ncbi:hypothetical protein Zm00014a_002783 [Zea mays]|uniref:Uncharacterized protein n=1 Tax=Zea mays TaxID=4577 RepID=A0A3L6F4Z8_MAIZE|nr:hypothetical protein Zm00014a_002783 [Zea mays]
MEFNGAVTLSPITPSHQWRLEPTVSPSLQLSLPLPSYKAEAAPTEFSLPQRSSLPPKLASLSHSLARCRTPSPEFVLTIRIPRRSFAIHAAPWSELASVPLPVEPPVPLPARRRSSLRMSEPKVEDNPNPLIYCLNYVLN